MNRGKRMLYLIGLGLNDENDMTLKAISLLKQCDKIYAEFYTNIWQGSIENISRMVNKNIEVLERESVESELLIKEAKDNTIALLVPGDPLSATTHFELIALARQNNIKCEIVHAPSIYTAIAETGLQLYKFGRSTTSKAKTRLSKIKITTRHAYFGYWLWIWCTRQICSRNLWCKRSRHYCFKKSV